MFNSSTGSAKETVAQSAIEWNAAVYHQAANPHVNWGAGVVSAAALQGHERVADLGCGTGRVTEQLLEQLPLGHVIAIDRSANMIDQARANLEPRFPGRVSFLQRDLLELGPDDIDGPVDVVFSTATFHWIRDHQTLFANIFAILKPGGRLIAQCGGGENLKMHVERAEALMASQQFHQWFDNWDAPNFSVDQQATEQNLQEAGFSAIETLVTEAPVVLADAGEFNTFLTTIVFREHLEQIPDAAAREEFIAELTRMAAADEPAFLLDYWRLNMRGVRPGD